MSGIAHAFETFFEQISSVTWWAVALAFLCHVAKMACRTRAWRNVIAAAYPGTEISWPHVFGAYVAGVGVNAVVPARGGDVLKLFLVKRSVEGSTYPTLAGTLVVETLFDALVAAGLVTWAVLRGALPGLEVLPRLQSLDWGWVFRNPAPSVAIGAGLAGLLALLVVRFKLRLLVVWARLVQGLAVLGSPGLYLRRVVSWQVLDWAFRLATVYWFLRAFGLTATLENALLVQVTQSLSTLLPITPGGFGTEQALVVYVFAGTLATGALLSFSVGMKLMLTAANVVLGATAVLVLLRTLRWRHALAGDSHLAEWQRRRKRGRRLPSQPRR